ncbi:HD domain-containing protein [Intrasporangium sp. YIM S08009]|uniref:HD domain-containing protein n=1 Tax=Intrasporangium zincisolvens TaxID=3080018 RepID=UPI002B05A7E8|nr:HD domain-containing protein [Intrasporangium sp. YIM S08009]
MLPKLEPRANHYGQDVARSVPDPTGAALDPHHADIWHRAAPYLAVRDNDVHTLYAHGLARALLGHHPEADPEVVLPAILLHDTGWSQVPEPEVLAAIAPGAGNPETVLRHEKEGARIAMAILADVGHDASRAARVVEIVDGHDSRREALSVEDAIVKDADKLWRLTPHGVDTVMDWFGLTRAQAHRLIDARVHDHLFTDAARTMARALSAVAGADTLPQRIALG